MEGNAKEMRKWAYEIHSSFLVPDAVRIITLITVKSIKKSYLK